MDAIDAMDDIHEDVNQSLPPSHIQQDGKFIYLPAPTEKERVRFFERSVARHKLLEADLRGKTEADSDQEDQDDTPKKSAEPKIHPLALASARLQSDGINELNRAINLQMLASSGEYFGLSNIVDPSLELAAAATSVSSSEKAKGDGGDKSESATTVQSAPISSEKYQSEREVIQEQQMKAMVILKRKRSQFDHAGRHIFRRHRRRLSAAIVAQSLIDRRLKELRPFWRLVAPEHGTRAMPHAARPTEVVAADVDVYRKAEDVASGRLASRVPRYATMELLSEYIVDNDLRIWKNKFFKQVKKNSDEKEQEELEPNEISSAIAKNSNTVLRSEGESVKGLSEIWTRAEPFAIADPALGKLDADFDPNKVTMLALQFDIEKPSTGFVQSACLEPIVTEKSTLSGNGSESNASFHKKDENLLVSLQHSLFCAKLFESIRRELTPDTEEIGNVRTSARQSAVWLSGASEENFLPSASLMSGDRKNGLSLLSVVHIHEGDIKVLLDCEYALRIRLVEADEKSQLGTHLNGSRAKDKTDTIAGSHPSQQEGLPSSGSQSSAQILALCQALLLHAQETYHRHSVRMEAKLRAEQEKEKLEVSKMTPHELQQKQQAKMNKLKSKDNTESPRILANCVSLGSKLLFERRIQTTILNIKAWIKTSWSLCDDRLSVEWLPLSIFDPCTHFTLSIRNWTMDGTIASDELAVTQFVGDEGKCYRKAKFYSDKHFELFLKSTLRNIFKNLNSVTESMN